MDDLSFGLSEPARILQAAGVRHLLSATASGQEAAALPIVPDGSFSSGGSGSPGQDPGSVLLTEPWSGFLAKAPPRPRTLWTYWELGADFGGAADPERSLLLRRLVGALEWPKGSVGFWPCSLLDQGSLSPQVEGFLAGMHRLRPPTLVVFGRERFFSLFATAPSVLEELARNVPVFYAPSLVEILAFEQPRLGEFLLRLQRFYSSVFSMEGDLSDR